MVLECPIDITFDKNKGNNKLPFQVRMNTVTILKR